MRPIPDPTSSTPTKCRSCAYYVMLPRVNIHMMAGVWGCKRLRCIYEPVEYIRPAGYNRRR